MTTKNIAQAKKVTGQENIPFITPGASVEDISGYVITEDGLTALVESSFTAEQVTALTAERDAAVTARTTAESNLATANATIATRDARITELEGQLEAAQEQGADFQQTTQTEDPTKRKKVAFHLSSENPANKIADGLLGKPKEKKKD